MYYNKFIEKIKKFDVITIFRHINPDADAFGSQLGLKYWLNLNFPEKEVYVLGDENSNDDFFPKMDVISDVLIEQSLAIIVDSATSERIDGNYNKASYIIKIDHHVDVDPYGDLNIVEVKSAATCQLLAKMFFSFEEYKMNKNIAETLYRGLLTDTLAFKTSNTTSETLLIASKLSEYDLDIPQLNRDMFDKSLSEFIFSSKLRSKLQLSKDKKLGYVIMNLDEVNNSGLEAHQIRSNVSEFNAIKELEIWCVFTQKIENNQILYDGSLRSKTIVINELAQKFNGGGHKNACGVKDLTKEDLNIIINELTLLSSK